MCIILFNKKTPNSTHIQREKSLKKYLQDILPSLPENNSSSKCCISRDQGANGDREKKRMKKYAERIADHVAEEQGEQKKVFFFIHYSDIGSDYIDAFFKTLEKKRVKATQQIFFFMGGGFNKSDETLMHFTKKILLPAETSGFSNIELVKTDIETLGDTELMDTLKKILEQCNCPLLQSNSQTPTAASSCPHRHQTCSDT